MKRVLLFLIILCCIHGKLQSQNCSIITYPQKVEFIDEGKLSGNEALVLRRGWKLSEVGK